MSGHQGGPKNMAAQSARRAQERANAGWSWETHRRLRQHLTAQTLALSTRCHLCGGEGADTADHVIPRAKGGLNTLSNLRPAHQGCNSARGDIDLGEWFALHPLPHRPVLAPSREW